MGKLNKYQLSRSCTCHPEREHVAKGLCGSCYRKTRQDKASANHKRWRKKNLKYANEYIRQWMYGVTPERFNKMVEEQKGRCLICDQVMDLTAISGRPNALHIDHDHSCCTGRKGKQSCGKCVRGLLCGDCNRGLGSFHDDPIVLLRAIEYLIGARLT